MFTEREVMVVRPEKFTQLATIRKNIRVGELLKIDNLDNLQYMNLEVIKIKPDYSSWVSHTCHHDELIRDVPDRDPCKFKVHKVGRLVDCFLWLGICPVCLKYVIGVQKADPTMQEPKPMGLGRLVEKDLTSNEAIRKKAQYESLGRSVKIKKQLDGNYRIYLVG